MASIGVSGSLVSGTDSLSKVLSKSPSFTKSPSSEMLPSTAPSSLSKTPPSKWFSPRPPHPPPPPPPPPSPLSPLPPEGSNPSLVSASTLARASSLLSSSPPLGNVIAPPLYIPKKSKSFVRVAPETKEPKKGKSRSQSDSYALKEISADNEKDREKTKEKEKEKGKEKEKEKEGKKKARKKSRMSIFWDKSKKLFVSAESSPSQGVRKLTSRR